MAPKRKEIASSPQRQLKKPKRDLLARKLNDQLKEIVAALRQASLPKPVAKMLEAVVPLSLGEFSEHRHAFQSRVVEGLAGLLGEVEAALKKEVADKRSTRDEAVQGKPAREKDAAEAEEKLSAKIAEVQSAKVALAKKAMAFREAKKALAEAEEAKVEDGLLAQEAEKKKSDFLVVLENLTALKTTTAEGTEGKKKNSDLMALLKKHKFEESMMIALPAALAKAPEARGGFDAMVIGQLETEIDKKIAEQTKILADAVPGQEKCVAAVKAASEHLDAARGEQRVAAQFFDKLSNEQSELNEASTAAQKVVKEQSKVLDKLEKALHDAEVEVELFEQGPLEIFKELRERTEPPPAAEDDEAAAPMDEAPAETVEAPVAAC